MRGTLDQDGGVGGHGLDHRGVGHVTVALELLVMSYQGLVVVAFETTVGHCRVIEIVFELDIIIY